MSFYNDYRPKQFKDILGQDSIIKILRRQAETGRFSHSYLFHGPSGTGKTTTARILASALNCENHTAGDPCGQCQPCDMIARGSHWDTREIDTARFRGIDDIRDLCYGAYLSPFGKHKTYILDEAHMLTEVAQNALLKLIEEPPPYLTIIMCTTDCDKIIETVRSRCQVFEFKHVPEDAIVQKLQIISRSLGIQPTPSHLYFMAKCAKGNLRIAENTLEQMCALGK